MKAVRCEILVERKKKFIVKPRVLNEKRAPFLRSDYIVTSRRNNGHSLILELLHLILRLTFILYLERERKENAYIISR